MYFEVTSREWVTVPASAVESDTFYLSHSNSTTALESSRLVGARARGLDSVLTLQGAIRDLEIKLNIAESNRWMPGTPQWIEAEAAIDHAEYQSAIDKVEGLVVARLFELSKLNQSGIGVCLLIHLRDCKSFFIGVKLRTHIAKALKTRSKAIRSAVNDYNRVAAKFGRPQLDIEMILQYISLGQFDLLRSSRYDVATIPWMRSTERDMAIRYFKIQRAQEEIIRLNIEIKRLLAYIQNEEKVWEDLTSQLQSTAPHLAYQAGKCLKRLLCVNQIHVDRLSRLTLLYGYTGPIASQCWNREDDMENDDKGSDDEYTEDVMDATIAFVSTI